MSDLYTIDSPFPLHVTQRIDRIKQLEGQIEKLQNTLKSIQSAIPCHNSESGFVIDHCNENGDYVSTEWVDPTQIVFDIQKILSDASEVIK